MLIVKVESGGIDKALKQLKRKLNMTGVMRELRARQEFTKPSVIRRNEIKRAKYIQKLRDQEENL